MTTTPRKWLTKGETANDGKENEDSKVLWCLVETTVRDLIFFNEELDQETDPKRRILLSRLIKNLTRFGLDAVRKCKAVMKRQDKKRLLF